MADWIMRGKLKARISTNEIYGDCEDFEFDYNEYFTQNQKQIEIKDKNDDLNQYLFNNQSPNSDEKIKYIAEINNAINILEKCIKQDEINIAQLNDMNLMFQSTLPTRMIWSAIYSSKDPKDELTKWGKVLRDLSVIQSLKPQSICDKTKSSKILDREASHSFHDIVIDDKDDWMDSDWTEISQKDLNSKFIESTISFPEIKEKVVPLLNKKFEIKKEEIDLTISHYFDDTSGKKQGVSKIDYFIGILNESKSLTTKIQEEKESTQRLLNKLNDLDSELSSLLVNQIGNTVSLECEFIDEKTNLLKEKVANCAAQSKVLMNSVDSLLYGEKSQSTVSKIKELLVRKLNDNKREKERLVKESNGYQENKIHLVPLVRQYADILKKTREIDRQVSQLMKV